MDSSLSPSLMLFDNTDYCAGLIKHAKHTAEQIRDGETLYDFLAFDVFKYDGYRLVRHPDVLRIKKTLQRQAQRTKAKNTPIPYLRSQRSMCFLRAQAWLEVYNYPFFHRPDGTMVRRWIDEDGKERIGSRLRTVIDKYQRDEMGSSVVGYKKKKAKLVKDRITSIPVVQQPELECMEQWRMGLTKPSGEVPEPTPTITGWERGEVEHKARRKSGRLEFASV